MKYMNIVKKGIASMAIVLLMAATIDCNNAVITDSDVRYMASAVADVLVSIDTEHTNR